MLRIIALILLILTGLLTEIRAVNAEGAGAGFAINLRDTDITVLAEQMAEITGRTLIVHPDLTGKITVVSAEKLDAKGAWELFQAILRARGFQAVQSGAIWQVVPLDAARTAARADNTDKAGSQDFVTRLIRLNRIPAAEAVRVLRPLVALSGAIEALEEPNAVLLTDTSENAARIVRIATQLDLQEGRRSRVLRFRFAQAAIVGTAIAEVLGGEPTGARLSVDPESNTLLVRGMAGDLAEVEKLARALDVAPPVNLTVKFRTRVLKLRFGDATQVAELIRATLTSSPVLTSAVAESLEQNPIPGRRQPGEIPAVSVQAASEINAVVVRGTEQQIAEVAGLVQQLDQKRPQVLIEAAIVEVSGDVAKRISAQLGLGALAPPSGLAATSFSNGGASLGSILAALGVPNAALASAGGAVSIGNDDFGLLLQALEQTTKANLLSTPSLTTLDNQQASIIVGQNVPFRTGTFATDGNSVQPFTTIERKDVGISMTVLPRVNAGNVVQLDISQEVSSLVNANVDGAADLITNKRSIQTSVLVESGGTIVLGGLITRDELRSLQKVPGLGNVPILGNLFKSRARSGTNRTLFVFLKPTVLGTAGDIRRNYDQRLKELSAARTDLNRKPGGFAPARLEIGGLY